MRDFFLKIYLENIVYNVLCHIFEATVAGFGGEVDGN